jgi:uncharacterized membrane protein (UPF0127 family)
MYLFNTTTGRVIADDVRSVNNPLSRLIGLLGHATVAPSQGIWLAHCSAVHTMGMRATIDLIFLDAGNRVVGAVPNAVPNRPAFTCRGAKTVVELGAGSRLELVEHGHKLALVETDPNAAS